MHCCLKFFTSVVGPWTQLMALKTIWIREEIMRDLDDNDDEADENTKSYEVDGDVDDLNPFTDSDK